MIGPVLAQAAPFQEYEVKAAFLLNFARFVHWPARTFEHRDSPLVIGVLGVDPFGGVLDDTIRGERVGQRPVEIIRYRHVDEVRTCHILFIAASEADRLTPDIAALRSRAILTVCEVDGAARRGVMVRLISEQDRVRLRVNLGEAKAAGLVISSKLLRPAEIVTTEKD